MSRAMKAARAASWIGSRALSQIAARPLWALVAALAVAGGLTLFGAVWLLSSNLDRAVASWGDGVQMIVYLDESATDVDAATVEDTLRGLPAVASAVAVPREVAKANLVAELDIPQAEAAALEPSLFPRSIEVSFAGGVAEVASAHPLVDRLRASSAVSEVEFLEDWSAATVTVASVLTTATRAAALFALCLCALVVALALHFARQRDVTRDQLLVELGAGAMARRGPNAVEGALIGILGAGMALVALLLVYRHVGPVIGAALSSAGEANVTTEFLAAPQVASAAAAAALAGALGGWFSRGRATRA